jgi:uncharacterized membrane protein
VTGKILHTCTVYYIILHNINVTILLGTTILFWLRSFSTEPDAAAIAPLDLYLGGVRFESRPGHQATVIKVFHDLPRGSGQMLG